MKLYLFTEFREIKYLGGSEATDLEVKLQNPDVRAEDSILCRNCQDIFATLLQKLF
ncbi:MAG TPA: hypothetical protein VF658_06510 [Pyrinomonadaceae bacterium]